MTHKMASALLTFDQEGSERAVLLKSLVEARLERRDVPGAGATTGSRLHKKIAHAGARDAFPFARLINRLF